MTGSISVAALLAFTDFPLRSRHDDMPESRNDPHS
jgi:hypothetical protein